MAKKKTRQKDNDIQDSEIPSSLNQFFELDVDEIVEIPDEGELLDGLDGLDGLEELDETEISETEIHSQAGENNESLVSDDSSDGFGDSNEGNLNDSDFDEFDDLSELGEGGDQSGEISEEELSKYNITIGFKKAMQNRGVKIVKLIMHNFMTFQNSTVEFDDGLNVITGPNGSGKSVIFQAIKYVLGSNERDDRYSNWQGFIRDGTDYCSVEIHIKEKNSNYIIKRRTVRNGSIEYFLSRGDLQKLKRSTKQEVSTLVKELGFEPDNKFCFIAQGNINSIWNQSPVELAKVIEDGTNLSDFRRRINAEIEVIKKLQSKKKELETKKSASESELITLTPKYERFLEKQKIQARLKDLDIEKTWSRRENIELELIEQEKMLNEKDSYIQTYMENQNQINEKTKETKEEIVAYDKAIEEINNEINTLETEIALINNNVNQKSQGIGSIQEKIEYNKNEIEKQTKSMQTVQKAKDRDQDQINKLNDNLSKELIELSMSEKKEQTLSILQEKSGSIKDKLSEIKSKKDQVEKNQKTQNENLKKKNSELSKLQNKLNSNEKQLSLSGAYLRHKNNVSNLVEYLTNKIKTTEIHQFDVESQIKRLMQDLEEKRHELENLKEIAGQSKASERMTRFINEIKAKKYDLIGPIDSLIKFDEKYDTLFRSLISPENLNGFITTDKKVFNNSYQIIKKFGVISNIFYSDGSLWKKTEEDVEGTNYIDRALNLIELLSEDEEINNHILKILDMRLGNAIIVESIAQMYDFMNDNPKFKGVVIDLEGNIMDFSKVVSVADYGNTRKVNEQRKDAIQKIPVMEAKVREIENENVKLYQKKKQYIEELEDLRKDLITAPSLIKYVKEKEDTLRKIEKSQAERDMIKENIDKYLLEISEFDAEYQSYRDRIRELTKGTAFEDENIEFVLKIPDLIKSVRNEIEGKRKQISEYQIQLQQLNNKLEQHDEKIGNIQENLNRLENQKIALAKEIETLDVDTKKFVNEQIQKSELKKKKEMELMEFKSKKKDLEDNLENLNREKIQIAESIMSLKKDNESIIRQIEETRNSLNQIDSMIEKSKVEKIEHRDMESIEKEINQFEKELLKYKDCGEDVAARKIEVDTIIREISTKNKEIQDEITKGEMSVEKLKELHVKMFHIASKNLQKRVNEKFEISNTMIRIMIRNQGTFEDLGIQIGVRDTSPNYRNIKAISGGQRTMVALGIIMTIQEANPTPLNMFDEADTHLDAKNGNTIFSLMKKISQEVQILFFLPISDKPYIGLANKIIGITSQGQDMPSVILYYNFNVDFLKFVKKEKELEARKKAQVTK